MASSVRAAGELASSTAPPPLLVGKQHEEHRTSKVVPSSDCVMNPVLQSRRVPRKVSMDTLVADISLPLASESSSFATTCFRESETNAWTHIPKRTEEIRCDKSVSSSLDLSSVQHLPSKAARSHLEKAQPSQQHQKQESSTSCAQDNHFRRISSSPSIASATMMDRQDAEYITPLRTVVTPTAVRDHQFADIEMVDVIPPERPDGVLEELCLPNIFDRDAGLHVPFTLQPRVKTNDGSFDVDMS